MEIQVGKSAIFTKESIKVIQDKMRINCIDKFNDIYNNDLSLKAKRKGRNDDLKSNEMEEYKQEEKTLKNEIKELEIIKTKNTKTIEIQEKQKDEIINEIANKKKYNNKISLKSKAMLIKENEELQKELNFEKSLHYQYEQQYKSLKEKTDYLIDNLKKILTKLPQLVQDIVNRLFIYSDIQIQFFKQQYEPKKEEKKSNSFTSFTKQKSFSDDFEKEINREKAKEKDDFEL